jgi:hypothetical protein
MLLGMILLVGSQLRRVRGDKKGHFRPLKSKGTSDQASSSSSFPSKRGRKKGGIASNSSVSLQELCRETTPGFCGLLGHMVSKRFGYYPTRSSPGFRLATTSILSLVHLPQDSAKASTLRAEVKSLQDKGAIFLIDNPVPGPGFYSHIFVVPKKQKGSWRLIINFSRLNWFLRVPHIKMEATKSVAAAILPGDWAVSLDLRDAYLHIPVHPDYQHYLRFYFEGRVYQFKAMSFGLASAPLIFHSIIKAFIAPLHTLGLKLHFYLDD